VDADGIALAAAQALERRTREQARELKELRGRSSVSCVAVS
jgi:hypothetical protein